MSAVLEYIACALLLGGAAFALVGSWGLAKLSDFFMRLHGPTKASTLGVGGVLLGSMLWQAMQGTPSLRELLITLFLFMTAPVSAQLMAKAALALDPKSRPALPEPPPQAPAE
jgi:multicomponent K+:H+ antiporter subunit G